MASAWVDDDEWYECKNCGHEQRVSLDDVREQWDEDYLQEKLSEMADFIPDGYGLKCFANMSSETQCEQCEYTIEIVFQVNAVPIWYMSQVDEACLKKFKDIEILKVLPSDAEVDEYLDYDEYYDDEPEIELSEEPIEVRLVRLVIIAKTRMNRGFCHLGLDFQNGRIVRPLYRPQEGLCCWDRSLELGKEYNFTVLGSSDHDEPLTPLPHSNDDLIVDPNPIHLQSTASGSEVFEELQNMANTSVEDIFGSEIRQYKYVDEGTNCPSVGVLHRRGKDLRIFTNQYNKRCIKIGPYELPITAMEDIPVNLPDHPNTLVILGLGRPYPGTENNSFNPKRCYILCLRILQPI